MLFVALVMILSLVSCSSDDLINQKGDPAIAAQQNATEANKISAATLEQGTLITGATKLTGNPPAPNGSVDFELNINETTGIQKNGVDIKFSSSSDIAGAYIRFKDVDGNATASYFNVPATTFGNRVSGKKLLENNSRINNSFNANEKSINVDFTDVIPAGKFCYDICIYDNANNISAIQTVCVTVEAWGGNAGLVGDWIYMGSSEDSREENLNCTNGGTINALSSKIINRDISLSFNQDGTYKDYAKQEYFELDGDQTMNLCTLIYNSEAYKGEFKRTGNWAYDQRNNQLSIVMFVYQDILKPADSYEKEHGELITDALTIKELTSDNLVIEENINISVGNVNISRSIVYNFKRK